MGLDWRVEGRESAVKAVAKSKQNNSETVGRAHVGHFKADKDERVKSRAEGVWLALSKFGLLVEVSAVS